MTTPFRAPRPMTDAHTRTLVNAYRKRLASWGAPPPTCKRCRCPIEAGQLIGHLITREVLHEQPAQCVRATYLAALASTVPT
jgi:hypothetical protein